LYFGQIVLLEVVLRIGFRHSVAAALLIIASAGWIPSAWGAELKGTLTLLLAEHDRIKAAEEDLAAARERAKAALGVRYPTLGVTSHYGYEAQNKFESSNTSMPSREVNLELTQKLWNFGASSASIESARLTYKQAQENLETAKQTLMLEGISALLDVSRTQRNLEYAKQSVSNIKLQTELEDVRVQEGSGYSTDVLQAKSQLISAEKLRIKAEEEYEVALNRHKTVFGKYPKEEGDSPEPKIPTRLIPTSLERAIEIAQKNNPRLLYLEFGVQVAESTVAETKANELFPSVNMVAGTKLKNDVAGTKGYQGEHLVKVELSYDFNFGLSSFKRLQATKHDRQAAARRLKETRDQIEEQVRNKWKGLLLAQENASFLVAKTSVSLEFLKLTREERDLGRSSFMDVLTSETTLINALSEAVTAETSTVTKAYELLEVIGLLKVDWLQ
jgi:TolC family type I secretion outer membrane protein